MNHFIRYCEMLRDLADHSNNKVCVLLATYNGAPWLAEQLESLVLQQDVQLAVHVQDDGSTDGTWLMLEEFKRLHQSQIEITIKQGQTASGSAGANFRRMFRSVDVGSANYVALCDQDDIWLPRKLIAGIEWLESADAGGYSAAVEAFWPDGRVKPIEQTATPRAADFLFEGAGQGCTFLIKAPLFKRVQDFCRSHHDETEALHYHDWLIYLLARTWNVRWTFDPHRWLRYRQHGLNEIGSRGGLAAIRNRLRLIRHGWYRRQVQAASVIYRRAGGADIDVLEIAAAIARPDCLSLSKRLGLIGRLITHGRRHLGDRLVLAWVALLGWL